MNHSGKTSAGKIEKKTKTKDASVLLSGSNTIVWSAEFVRLWRTWFRTDGGR